MTFKEIVKLTDMGFTKDDIMKLTADTTSKDETSKDEISKDETSKDEISKDETSKDETSKDETSKDETSKDETSKDGTSKDETLKSELSELKKLIAEIKQTAINTTRQPEAESSIEDVIASIINPPKRKE